MSILHPLNVVYHVSDELTLFCCQMSLPPSMSFRWILVGLAVVNFFLCFFLEVSCTCVCVCLCLCLSVCLCVCGVCLSSMRFCVEAHLCVEVFAGGT